MVVEGKEGRLRTLCPYRFDEDGLIYRWAGELAFGDSNPIVLREIGFLESVACPPGKEPDDVGRIDCVLVSRDAKGPLVWCALETQAVYFQGDSMGKEWAGLANEAIREIPFPSGKRRPDYRSSGPKRLMPQLQIKVPSLRRWGKKMIVVVDEDFFAAMGPMQQVEHLSNCDIVWLVVGYDETHGGARLGKRHIVLTTLEHAVEGLTAGAPVSLEIFEQRIKEKMSAPPANQAIQDRD